MRARKGLLGMPNWPYAAMGGGWGGVGFAVETRHEMREALRAAHAVKDFVILECRRPPSDISAVSRRYIQASARKARAAAT